MPPLIDALWNFLGKPGVNEVCVVPALRGSSCLGGEADTSNSGIQTKCDTCCEGEEQGSVREKIFSFFCLLFYNSVIISHLC